MKRAPIHTSVLAEVMRDFLSAIRGKQVKNDDALPDAAPDATGGLVVQKVDPPQQ